MQEAASHAIPIVLTGTIIPAATPADQDDWRVRRDQYLRAIVFYRKLSKVYFLENSRYDLASDRAFVDEPACRIIKCDPADHPEKGKGHQEFQMLDHFVEKVLVEDCFVKVTGRYLFLNFDCLFGCLDGIGQRHRLIIDCLIARALALTSLFYVDKRVYLEHLRGCYRRMDDQKGVWAEHIVYDIARHVKSLTFLPTTPILRGPGSARTPSPVKCVLKNAERRVLSMLNGRRLLC